MTLAFTVFLAAALADDFSPTTRSPPDSIRGLRKCGSYKYIDHPSATTMCQDAWGEICAYGHNFGKTLKKYTPASKFIQGSIASFTPGKDGKCLVKYNVQKTKCAFSTITNPTQCKAALQFINSTAEEAGNVELTWDETVVTSEQIPPGCFFNNSTGFLRYNVNRDSQSTIYTNQIIVCGQHVQCLDDAHCKDGETCDLSTNTCRRKMCSTYTGCPSRWVLRPDADTSQCDDYDCYKSCCKPEPCPKGKTICDTEHTNFQCIDTKKDMCTGKPYWKQLCRDGTDEGITCTFCETPLTLPAGVEHVNKNDDGTIFKLRKASSKKILNSACAVGYAGTVEVECLESGHDLVVTNKCDKLPEYCDAITDEMKQEWCKNDEVAETEVFTNCKISCNTNPGALFALGTKGENSCLPGYTHIQSRGDCEAAATAIGKIFKRAEANKYSPTGCYAYGSWAIYNKHATGKRSGGDTPICTKAVTTNAAHGSVCNTDCVWGSRGYSCGTNKYNIGKDDATNGWTWDWCTIQIHDQ